MIIGDYPELEEVAFYGLTGMETETAKDMFPPILAKANDSAQWAELVSPPGTPPLPAADPPGAAADARAARTSSSRAAAPSRTEAGSPPAPGQRAGSAAAARQKARQGSAAT